MDYLQEFANMMKNTYRFRARCSKISLQISIHMRTWMTDLRPRKVKTCTINKLKPTNELKKQKKMKNYVLKKKDLNK